jgi:arylformamidase
LFPSVFEIIDISQPITSTTACFPGDVPFSKKLTVNYDESKVINLTAMTLSPHVGTHADSPSHIQGDIANTESNIGSAPLSPYIGHCLVVDLSPLPKGPVTADLLRQAIGENLASAVGIARVLVKTLETIRYDQWQDEYAYFGQDAIEYLQSLGCKLVGIDTPSVDHVTSKELPAHHALNRQQMFWLENLDLTSVESGSYFLVAAPLRFVELEASPLRAVLLR